MLIKESTIRRIIREEARRVLREADDYTIPVTPVAVGNAYSGPVTTTWKDGEYTYSYNPGNDQMFIVSGPKMTASKQVTKTSNSTAYYTILNQYEAKMGLPKTAPTAPPAPPPAAATGMSDQDEIYNMIKNAMTRYKTHLQTNYDNRLKQIPDLRGTWALSFTIKTDGTVKNAKVTAVSGTTPDKMLEDNMVKSATSWKFAALAEEQPVTWNSKFAPTY
jgi:hypothetical protein